MSDFTYTLNKLSQQQQQQARYEVILQFVSLNPYFAYLPYITNPTNNYYKYSEKDLKSILLVLQYGNIEDDNEPMKKVYHDFVKDYQHNSEIYVREKQEEMMRYQEQVAALQFAIQYNAETQPVAFNANPGQTYRQKQQYGYENQEYNNRPNYRDRGRDGRRQQYNREPSEPQVKGQYHPREQNEKKGHEHLQRQQHRESQNHQHPNHEEHHLWHKFHTKSGDVIGFESKAEYEEFAHFKKKYGLNNVKIKFDPLARFELENRLLDENKHITEPISATTEPIPKKQSKKYKLKVPLEQTS